MTERHCPTCTCGADLLGVAPAEASDLPAQIVALWNRIVTAPIPQARLTPETRRKIQARLKSFPKVGLFETAFREANRTDWFRGENGRAWVIDLPWLMGTDTKLQRFVDAGMRHKGPAKTLVTGCRHKPGCTDASVCTRKKLQEQA